VERTAADELLRVKRWFRSDAFVVSRGCSQMPDLEYESLIISNQIDVFRQRLSGDYHAWFAICLQRPLISPERAL
jgi:hypothetical protein